MAVALTTTLVQDGVGKTLKVIGEMTVSGNYAAGGESLADILPNANVPGSAGPIFCMAYSPGGYSFAYSRSTAKLLVYAGATELATAAYPAALTGSVICFLAHFKKG